MTHYMNLWDDSFQAIKEGWKTVEMRLNDEKKSIISAKYADFTELYKHHNKVSIGYKEDEIANPDDMLLYYTREDIEKYGVVGLELAKNI